MDKFVKKSIRTSRRPNADVKEIPSSMKQATLESLKRVVVVEDILKCKAILSVPEQSSDILLNELYKLRPKIPSIEVLKTTKLGRVLKKLTRHDDERVARSALNLVDSWKTDIRERKARKSMDVRCDLKTDRSRKETKRSLRETLAGKKSIPSDELANIVEEIEREVFNICGKKINETYRKTVRKIVFSLRHRSDLRKQVIERKTSVNILVMANIQK